MHLPFVRRTALGAGVTTALLIAGAMPASAHITIPDGQAIVAGSTAVISLRVPHGCAGAPTDTIEVKIPDGVTGVKPRLMDGWDITTQTTPPPSPAASYATDEEAEAASEPQVSVITWSGGSLPDSMYQDFQFEAIFPDTPGTLSFPVVQKCGGTEEAWIEIPAAGQDPEELENPAPQVTVIATGPAPEPPSASGAPAASEAPAASAQP
jgi:uncharacterized protein YcnI